MNGINQEKKDSRKALHVFVERNGIKHKKYLEKKLERNNLSIFDKQSKHKKLSNLNSISKHENIDNTRKQIKKR